MQVILLVASLRPLQVQPDLREAAARPPACQPEWPQGGLCGLRVGEPPCAVVLRSAGQDSLFIFPLGTREVTTTCSPPRIPLRPNHPLLWLVWPAGQWKLQK